MSAIIVFFFDKDTLFLIDRRLSDLKKRPQSTDIKYFTNTIRPHFQVFSLWVEYRRENHL